MKMPEPIYTESQMNQMLSDQKINLRLNGIEDAINKLSTEIAEHKTLEKKDTAMVMDEVEKGNEERRKCEEDLKDKFIKMDAKHYKIFVKKSELKVYTAIIILTVSITTGFITWFGTQHEVESTTNLIQELKILVKGAKP